jgi:hypothetical protein
MMQFLKYVLVAIFASALILEYDRRTESVQAAPADPVPLCLAVAKAGTIDIYYCEPDVGPSFLINSVGFMAVEP